MVSLAVVYLLLPAVVCGLVVGVFLAFTSEGDSY